jgi:hypothetical protein
MKFNLKSFRLGDFLSKRINTILLIVILIVILTGHVVCSCSKVSVKKVVEKFTGKKEGAMSMGSNGSSKKKELELGAIKKVIQNKVSAPKPSPTSTKPILLSGILHHYVTQKIIHSHMALKGIDIHELF